jgi:hypothetical protein
LADAQNRKFPVEVPQVSLPIGNEGVPKLETVAPVKVNQPVGKTVSLKFWVYGDVPKFNWAKVVFETPKIVKTNNAHHVLIDIAFGLRYVSFCGCSKNTFIFLGV